MTDVAKTGKKKIVPKAGKKRTYKQASEATNKQYAGTLAKLAK